MWKQKKKKSLEKKTDFIKKNITKTDIEELTQNR